MPVPTEEYAKIILLKNEVVYLRTALRDLVKSIEITEGNERETLHKWKAFLDAKTMLEEK